mmetsp:Transcript_21807/g.32856  ORF Transcript_21807/g.32856 Transcript_21807/m.32856 type:complete len:121 (+) Transcript_21807:3-365(+)
MSLCRAGFVDESTDLLKVASRSASSARRRDQAKWVLDVQNVDVGDAPAESSLALRELWDAIPLIQSEASYDPGTAGNGAGVGLGGGSGSKDYSQFYVFGLVGLLAPVIFFVQLLVSRQAP